MASTHLWENRGEWIEDILQVILCGMTVSLHPTLSGMIGPQRVITVGSQLRSFALSLQPRILPGSLDVSFVQLCSYPSWAPLPFSDAIPATGRRIELAGT